MEKLGQKQEDIRKAGKKIGWSRMLDKDFQNEALEMVGRKELDLEQNDVELENDASVEYDEEDDYDDEVEVNDDEEDGGVEVAKYRGTKKYTKQHLQIRSPRRAAARTSCG